MFVRLTRGGSGEDASATGDLDIADDLVLESDLDGNGLDRVLDVHAAVVEVRNVEIRGGSAGVGGDETGGAIRRRVRAIVPREYYETVVAGLSAANAEVARLERERWAGVGAALSHLLGEARPERIDRPVQREVQRPVPPRSTLSCWPHWDDGR